MKKMLITGGSGLLGCNAAYIFSRGWDVSAVSFKSRLDMPGVACIQADIRDKNATKALLDKARPDVVFHTAAVTDVDGCERDPKAAYELHVSATENIASWTKSRGAKLVHVSTDHFYPGGGRLHAEDEPPEPLNIYASTKYQGEKAALMDDGALVVRTNIYGWNAQPKTSFAEWILRGLAGQGRLTLFDDVFFSPILVNDLVAEIGEAIEKDLHGVYNIAGGQRISKYEFALTMGEIFRLPSDTLKRASIDGSKLAARRPKDMSMDVRRIEAALGRRMPTVREGLKCFRDLKRTGYSDMLKNFVSECAAA